MILLESNCTTETSSIKITHMIFVGNYDKNWFEKEHCLLWQAEKNLRRFSFPHLLKSRLPWTLR